MATDTRALTVVEQVETSPAVLMLESKSQALVDLLPDAEAVRRFKRVVVQAIVKNPELLQCTPESVVSSVFEAAMQGLEPTGAAGGAHLVPYNVNVAPKGQRPRYEKRAQLIPDYRGVIRLVTKPPSDIASMEARVVKEGDEFSYQLGDDSWVHHVPSLAPDRSRKATTHWYSIARLRGEGRPLHDVMDRAEIERIQKKGGFAWTTDQDEMGKKTVIKRHSKTLPVRPEIRSILVREDELAGTLDEDRPALPAATAGERQSRARQLATRLRPELAQEEESDRRPVIDPAIAGDSAGVDDSAVEGEAREVGALTADELTVAIDSLGITRQEAAAVSAQLYPREKGTPLTDEQRYGLVQHLRSQQHEEDL